ncbi:MAG: PD-(D/E)XK nuclease family protein [Candidatus Omnitrophota bacterium]
MPKKQFYSPLTNGVTQGILDRFMGCRKSCKIFLEGWSTKGVKHGLTFGTISHGCLELAYKDIISGKLKGIPSSQNIAEYVTTITEQWHRENPRVDKYGLEVLEYCAILAEAVLPNYFKFWEEDLEKLNWINLEDQFNIPYTLKSGKYAGVTIPISGKKDGQFTYSSSEKIWLFETKNLSRIEEGTLAETLPLNLQVNLYLWALRQEYKKLPAGILYNIIRRPGLRQKVSESLQQFAVRCAEDISKRPEFYFIRLEIKMLMSDMDSWEKEFNNLLSDFYAWWKGDLGTYGHSSECNGKYGRCEYLPICAEEDYSSVGKRKVVYRELNDM